MSTYYEFLRLEPSASTSEIEQAIAQKYQSFRMLSVSNDQNVANSAKEALANLNRIGDVLLDSQKRQMYDITNGISKELRIPFSTLQVISDGQIEMLTSMMDKGLVAPPSIGLSSTQDKQSLRNWWHIILKEHGRFSCYGMFLVLPSDAEAYRYLSEFEKEIDLLSGSDCLVIATSSAIYKTFGLVKKNGSVNPNPLLASSEGLSIKIANLFNIKYSEFPCLLLFSDVRSPEHIVVSLKNITADEISSRLRYIFTIIHNSVQEKKDVLATINRQRQSDEFQKTGWNMLSNLQSFAGKTVEQIVEILIKASVA